MTRLVPLSVKGIREGTSAAGIRALTNTSYRCTGSRVMRVNSVWPLCWYSTQDITGDRKWEH